MKEDHPAPQDSGEIDSENQTSNEYSGLTPDTQKMRSPQRDETMRCSQCGMAYLRSSSPFLPFCSVRCQQIDLGNWLDEAYGLPIEGHEEREFGTVEEDSEHDGLT